MAKEAIGYSWISEKYKVPAIPGDGYSYVDTAARSRSLGQDAYTGNEIQVFDGKYRLNGGLRDHLEFAIRHERIRLDFLSVFFNANLDECANQIERWIATTPASMYARLAGFYFEFLTGREISCSVKPGTPYVDALDSDKYFTAKGDNNRKFMVRNNLPGNRMFCPVIRKTKLLPGSESNALKDALTEKLSSYDHKILERAASYLYLKETHCNFEIEREKPSPNRAQRFASMLSLARQDTKLSEDFFVSLQNSIIDPILSEASYRAEQNWVGDEVGYIKRVDFIPPKPEDVPGLMHGLVDLFNSPGMREMDPVAAATSLAFGFVFIHPFKDGNGRIHRFLIHQSLTKSGFTPEGMILPVSAVMLASIDEYRASLESFSRPLLSVVSYHPDVDAIAKGNDRAYYAFPDLTSQAEFLYQALDRTIRIDIGKEIDYLILFDKAKRRLNEEMDWPKGKLDLMVNLLIQNDGEISNSKRKSQFEFLPDEMVLRCEDLFHELAEEDWSARKPGPKA